MAEARALEPESAQLLAWVAAAGLNQLLIGWLLPQAEPKTTLLHHAYDAGQLLALGALSWLVVRTVRLLARRRWPNAALRRRTQVAGLALVVLLVSVTTLGGDVSNLAERSNVAPWLLTLGASLGFAAVLGASRLLGAFQGRASRVAEAVLGLALFAANALFLHADYFGCHLMTAWLGVLLLANALEGIQLRPWQMPGPVSVTLCGALGVLSVLWPPRGDVRLRLYALPSSVLAPLLAGFLPTEAANASRVPARYRDSEWFSSRAKLGPVPPTHGIVPPTAPIVMFFTIDAFRADVLDSPRHRQQLPELTRLLRESTYFAVARSPTTSTMTTMASVFSGKYYSQLLWSGARKKPLAEPTPRFPELLAEHGVRTFLAAGTLGQIYGRSGIARGFASEVAIPYGPRPSALAVNAIIAELERSIERPRFVYSHFIEPHAPYDLAGPEGSSFERYVREIAMVDQQLGRLRRYLETKGLAERTYLIVAADHGEAFGEHGTYNHARTTYEELVRVPLIFYAPGQPARRLETPVTLMDIGPTVLDLFGVAAPGFWMGQSLLPLVAGQRSTLSRPIAVDTGRRVQALCFDDGYKVIFSRLQHTTEVYDLKTDPRELTNLAFNGADHVLTAVETARLFFDNIELKNAGYTTPEQKF